MPDAGRSARIPALDIARSAALLAMIVFHMVRDLETFGLVSRGTTLEGGWAVLARATAASFLCLAGMSLVLAHGDGLRIRAFARQMAKVAGAALLVTLASAAFAPDRLIYFGILHAIALSCIVAVPFLRLSAPWAFGAALGVFALGMVSGRDWDGPLWLGWTGLTVFVRPSLDLVPLVPWCAACILGVGLAKVLPMPPRCAPQGPARLLVWPGRHSLAIYLLHQPVLIALIWLGVQVL